MRLPRLNRLTGLRWWRRTSVRDVSETSRLRQEALIRQMIHSPGPLAMGKIGTSELLVMEYPERWIRSPWPSSASWRRPAERLFHSGGLFPVCKQIFNRFVLEYADSVRSMDLVSQWQETGTYESALEQALLDRLCPQATRVGYFFLRILNPRAVWLDDLASLRWLVIHPFAMSIRHQLPRLAGLNVYSDSSHGNLARRALDTVTIPCPQLPYMVPPRHRDWFQALEELKARMEKQRDLFDIALIGAGAWSMPLVAHAKKLGKKGMHLGGALQLLFGIKGGRFDRDGIYNDQWIRPLTEERPANHRLMENGAYW